MNSVAVCVLCALFAFTLTGCGGSGGGGSTTKSPHPGSTTASPHPGSTTKRPIIPGTTTNPGSTTYPGPTTTSTTLVPQVNIWQWRADMEMGPQITYDLSANIQEHCLYGGCWRTPGVETLAGDQWIQYQPADKQFLESGKKFGEYAGSTGVSLYNLRNDSAKPGCLMRKSRLPIDLSEIGRLEMDVKSSGSSPGAPWYAIWLAPMLYGPRDDNAKSAEIDLIENYQQAGRGHDVNDVNTNFAQCGDIDYTKPYCSNRNWGSVATKVDHHITLKAVQDPVDGRKFEVHRCPNTSGKMETCSSPDPAWIKVEKAAPPDTGNDWFPVWNKKVAKDHYAKYWLVADMWWTSNTDFKLSANNIKFYKNDDSEWTMPLDGPPPSTQQDGEAMIV